MKKGNMMQIKNLFVMAASFVLVSCSSTSKTNVNISDYAARSSSDYSKYLVPLESYTTGGSVYHQKYLSSLKGLAKHLKEDRKIDIVEGSIGFYYDRKLNDRERLYIGFDFDADPSSIAHELSYSDNARSLIMKYYLDILEIAPYLSEVMAERSVDGMVIGIKWTRSGRGEVMNLWTSKKDLATYSEKGLTFRELVYRSIVTDTEGKIVRITL